MKRRVILNGEEHPLVGDIKSVGDMADNFTVMDVDMEPIEFYTLPRGVKIVSSCTSLNTPMCSMQTKRLNAEIYISTRGLSAYNISVDLPFFQARYSFEEDIEYISLMSDYKYIDFGQKFGVYIEDLRLLSRAIFVIDKDNVIQYAEYLLDNDNQFNYVEAVRVAKELISRG